MNLRDSLSKIARRMQEQRERMQSDMATVTVSVLPFVRALGCDIQNLGEAPPAAIA